MEALGINVVNMLINFVLFMAFFALIHKVVGKKLSQMLTDRQLAIDAGIENTKKAKDLIEVARKEHDTILAQSKHDAEEILSEARKSAEIESHALLQKVEEEATAIREKANTALTKHQKKLDAEFDQKVETAVKASLEKLFKDNPEFKK